MLHPHNRWLISAPTMMSAILLVTAAATAQTKVTVTASAWEQKAHGGFADFPPENTIDGLIAPRSSWRAEGIGVWIQYDLGEVKTVEGVALAVVQGDTRQYFFDILISETGEEGSWRTVREKVETSGKTKGMENYTIEAAKARFVRLVGRGNTNERFAEWFNITEAAILTQ